MDLQGIASRRRMQGSGSSTPTTSALGRSLASSQSYSSLPPTSTSSGTTSMSSSATFDFPSYMTQEEGNKKLFQAVLSGKVDTVREVLSYGFSNINATSGQDKTPLMLAARAGYTEMVYFLLSQGANAELETKRGETASSMALHWGHTEVVQALENWIRQQKRDREALSSSSSLSSSFLANLWKPIRKGSADSTPTKGSKEAAPSTIVRSSTSPPLLTNSSSLVPTNSTPVSSSLPSTPQGARTPTSPPISILSSFSPSTSTSTSSLSSTSSPRSTPESSLVREDDDDEQQHFSGLPPAEGSVIDGNRISMTHEEFNAILAKEEQRYRDKERELRARLQRDQENNLNRWLAYLAKKKRKKKDRVDTIQMLRQQNATLQQRNNELRDRVLQLEKERKAWVTYGHGLFCPTPASQGVEGGEAALERLPINANLDYFCSVEPYRRGRWEDPLQGVCLLKGRGPNATTYTIKTALLASRQGEEAALALENEVDSTLFHLPPHPNALNAVLAFTDSLPAAVAAEDWPSLPKSKKEVSRSAKFFVFEDLENYTTLQRVIRQRKRKIGSRLNNNNQQREGEETTSSSSSSSSSSPRRHLLQQPVYLLPPKHIAFLVLQLLEMANHLYSHGIVHRNLSPANIFVRSTAAAAKNANGRDGKDRNSTNAKKTKKKEQGDGDHIATRAHRRSREADASPGDPAGEGVLDIVPVDGVEPVEEGDDASSTRSTSADVESASRSSDEESEDEDGDVELIDVSANEAGDSSDQDIYRLRVGNFSESIQVMKLPYSSRLISLGSSPSSIYLAPEVSSARPGRGVLVDYRKQDVWSIGVILHQLIYGRKPTAESIDALLDDHRTHLDEGQAAPTSRHTLRHPLKQPRHHQQHQQPRHSRDRNDDDDDNGWTTTALDVLLRRLLEPRASERFSASFALLFLRFALFGPKQRPMWRTHEQWVAWLRERRRLRPHPFYGECMARGATRLLKKTTMTTSSAAAVALDEAGGNVVDAAGQEGGDGGGDDDYVPGYLEWQHTQFVWSATPADLLAVVSCFEASA